jgi:hypothetical protein
MLKSGTQCLICTKIYCDKSTFNRHHKQAHHGEPQQSINNILYKECEGEASCDINWTATPLHSAPTSAACGPGLLERQTQVLQRGLKHFSDLKWAVIADPQVAVRDEAVSLIDEIDDFAIEAPTVVRSQVMRTKSGNLKDVPFQPLKDLSGAHYAHTLARFILFARIFFQSDANAADLVQVYFTWHFALSTLLQILKSTIYMKHVETMVLVKP